MSALQIDADALYRAVSAYDYKLLAYYLDLRSGEVVARTLTPEELQEPPRGPSVKPLPVLGGDLNVRKADAPFGPTPAVKKPGLFKDDGPQKARFEGDFWKRAGPQKNNPFGGAEFKLESGTKKLAELFGEAPPEKSAPNPFAAAGTLAGAGQSGRPGQPARHAETSAQPGAPQDEQNVPPANDPHQPLWRIPPASVEQQRAWMSTFATGCGDPQIKERLLAALASAKPFPAYERALRNFQRMNQQWSRYYRKQTLHYAAAWLKDLPVSWEIVDSGEPPVPI